MAMNPPVGLVLQSGPAGRRRRGLERDLLAQQSSRWSTSGHGPAEIKGVHADLFAVTAPGTTGRSGQDQRVRLAVPRGPLAHDIVDDHALVRGGGFHRDPGGTADVEAVHERITGQDDVEQESERPLLLSAAYRLRAGHGAATDERGHLPAPACGPRADRVRSLDDLSGAEAGVLCDLKRREYVDHDRTGLLRAFLGGHLL